MFLGYHEEIKDNPNSPTIVTELRRSAFARIYSDDKNVAVFLGRPPRLSQRFCCFQLPQPRTKDQSLTYMPVVGAVDFDQTLFGPDDDADQHSSIRWSALCAVLKEEALELIQRSQRQCLEYNHTM